MRVDLFDFDLPDERIALRPAEPRDAARLLVVRPGQGLADRIVRDLPGLLAPGDALVFNDTKVIPARLEGTRRRGDAVAQVEATLHMRAGPDRWLAFLRPAKRVAQGEREGHGTGREARGGEEGEDADVAHHVPERCAAEQQASGRAQPVRQRHH